MGERGQTHIWRAVPRAILWLRVCQRMTPSQVVGRRVAAMLIYAGDNGADEPGLKNLSRWDLTFEELLSTVSFVVCLHCVWD